MNPPIILYNWQLQFWPPICHKQPLPSLSQPKSRHPPGATEEPTMEPAEITPTVEPTQSCPEYGVEEFDVATPCWPSDLSEMKSITALTNSPNEFAGINNGKLEFSML